MVAHPTSETSLQQEFCARLAADPQFFDWLDNHGGDGWWYCDCEQDRLWLSRKGFKTLGYDSPPETFTLEDWHKHILATDLPIFLESTAALIAGNEREYDDLLRCRHVTGQTLWLRYRGNVGAERDGKVTRLCGTITNITPLMAAEHQLETLTHDLYEINQRHRLALKASGIGVWDFNMVSNELVWSPEMYALYHEDPKTYTPSYENWAESVLPADRPIAEGEFQRVLSAGETKYVMEFRIVDRHRHIRYIGVNADIFYREGQPYRVLGVNWDNTEDRLQALALQQRTHELQHSNQDLEEFATIVSHDLQEPLRKIHGFAELLAEECRNMVSEDGLFYLNRITDAGQRMERLINNLLELSQVTRHGLHADVLSLNQMVADLARESEETINLICDPLPKISADKTLMQQVFFNLLHNSHRFRRPQMVAEVHVRSSGMVQFRNQNYWEIRFCDRGQGFDNRDRERIFKPFEQLKRGNNPGAGDGIGLTKCRKIMERHGGWIDAEGTPEKGTVFRLLFPEKMILASA